MKDINVQFVKNIINSSYSKNECYSKLNWKCNGHNQRLLNDIIITFNIDISHFNRNFYKRKYDRITKVCPVCDTKFETKKHPTREGVTCSKSCAASWFRVGKDNPNWKNKSYRSIAFKFHGKKCIVCPEIKILDVHHIDENRENNTKQNLIPLCPTHHRYVHSRYKKEILDKIVEYMASVA